jgi:putative NIF3 family GTP cyclohydrolase 1 type 2
MTDTVAQWVELVHDRYPPAAAADWDQVGLHVGDPSWEVERVLVTLDVTSAVVTEAADGPPTLIVAHHPLLFRPLERLTPATAPGRIALAAAGARVAVLAAHTNLDVADDGAGTSDPVVDLLGLEVVVPLRPDQRAARDVKLVTFVPRDHVDAVLDALAAAGAGVIGEYERCSFRVTGTGTFRPGTGADPYVGGVGQDNEETEDRLEIVEDEARLAGAGGGPTPPHAQHARGQR